MSISKLRMRGSVTRSGRQSYALCMVQLVNAPPKRNPWEFYEMHLVIGQ